MVEAIKVRIIDGVNDTQPTDEDNQQSLMVACNSVIIERTNNPGSPKHYEAMGKLVDIISDDPGALDLLKVHQIDK